MFPACSGDSSLMLLAGEMDAFTCGCWRALTNFSPNSNHCSSSNGSQLSSSNGSPISNHGCCFQETDLDQDRISLPPLRKISHSNASGPLNAPSGSPSTACGSPAGSHGKVALKSLHGAPAGSLAVRLAELMAGIGSPEEMARLWLEVMQEVRDRWEEGIAIPHVYAEREGPDGGVCGVLQHWQVLNCAVARKRWRKARISSNIQRHLQHSHLHQPNSFPFFSETAAGDFGRFEPTLCKTCGSYNLSEVLLEVPLQSPLESPVHSPPGGSPRRFVEGNGRVLGEKHGSCSWACFPDPAGTGTGTATGKNLELTRTENPFTGLTGEGCDGGGEAGEMRLLVAGARMCEPEVQDGPLITSVYLAELEEAIMHTGSLNIAHKRLFSDMQAFKAANPGCILEDFVRWYSPADWSSDAPSTRMGGVGGHAGGAGGEDSESTGSNDEEGCVQGKGERSKTGYLSTRMSGPALQVAPSVRESSSKARLDDAVNTTTILPCLSVCHLPRCLWAALQRFKWLPLCERAAARPHWKIL
ncbi:unnamed protein product [Closterium sp. Naga37s-1]|nr:unnamed protein product [Closterium sp. Naga37s-1]